MFFFSLGSGTSRQDSFQFLANLPEGNIQEKNYILEFLKAISPIKAESWSSAGIFGKISMIIKFIPTLVFKLTVPVFEEDENEVSNWNKFLACLHCIISPAVAMFLVNVSIFNTEVFPGASIWMLMPAFTFPLAVIVWCTSDFETPPKYFRVSVCVCVYEFRGGGFFLNEILIVFLFF